MVAERLQKVLAAAGVASRRHSEEYIRAGRVAVNGRTVTERGTRVDPARDRITLDGRPIHPAVAYHYIAFHKPRGYLTTASDERGRSTVFNLLGQSGQRVFTVGRLDKDSEGLLLLTNDGALAFRLTHPRYGIEREYRVLLEGAATQEGVTRLRDGAVVEGRRVKPLRAAQEATAGSAGVTEFWVRIVLTEGRKREVRMIAQAAGYAVRRLVRVRYGPISLGNLPVGATRPLTANEVDALRRAVGLQQEAGAAAHG
jgi:23S rRNA pseudouridine2605 synthase